VIDHRAIEAFIYHEARLIDEMEYAAWFALWDPDGVYHVPICADTPGAQRPGAQRRQVSIINDDYVRLEQRVDRLKTGSVLAMAGQRGAMRRVVSNIEILEHSSDGEVEIGSNFILGVARTAEQQLWIGRTVHRLRSAGEQIRLVRKTVLLINSAHETPLLQFLI
jgi:3-phenylpropionate/cinnamic acid dioxygenase small subunit